VNPFAARVQDHVRGVIGLTHNIGMGRMKLDLDRGERVLIGLGSSPNVAAVLLVAMGCDEIPADRIAEGIGRTKKPVELLRVSDERNFFSMLEKGVNIARDMVQYASELQREPADTGELTVALKCGGSGPSSGIAGNPSAGVAADMILQDGGTVIFSETTELMGAEHILEKRAASKEVAERIWEISRRNEAAIEATGLSLRGSQPTPGNVMEGLTTIEEKSLGSIIKSGSMPIQAVLEYGERPKVKGLCVMDSTASTIELLTGEAATGAQVHVFVVGGNLPCLTPINPGHARVPTMPSIKVISSSEAYELAKANFDVNAGPVLEGTASKEEIGEKIYREIVKVASGKMTRSETINYWDQPSIFTVGPLV